MNENEFEWHGKKYVAASRRRCSGCAFFDEDFNCDMIPSCESEKRFDGRNVIYVELPKPEPKTNADRIRGMSNEELADFMDRSVKCARCPAYKICNKFPREKCKVILLDWLNSPAEEESEEK